MKKVEWQSPDKGKHSIKYLLQFSWQSRWHFCKKRKLNILNQIPFYSKTQAIPKWRSLVCTSQGAELATRWFGNFVFMYFAVTPRTRAEKGPGRVWMNKGWKTQNSWLWVHGMGSSTFLSRKNNVQRHSWRNWGKNCYRPAFAWTGITGQGTGAGKQRSNVVSKTTKAALENGNKAGISPDRTSWRETWHCHGAWDWSYSRVKKHGGNKTWGFSDTAKVRRKSWTNVQTKPTRLQLD